MPSKLHKILKIHPNDAYYPNKEDYIGRTCTATEITPNGRPEGFVGCYATFGTGKERRGAFFFAVKLEELPNEGT